MIGRSRQMVEHVHEKLGMFLELLGAFALKAGYLLFSRQLALSCLARIHRLDLTENLACFLHCGSGSKFICRQMKTFPRRRYLDYRAHHACAAWPPIDRIENDRGQLSFG